MSKRHVPLLVTMLLISFSSGVIGQQAVADDNCSLSIPPQDAGEAQAHGVILYIYPRSHTIDSRYHGCQSQWFFDDDHFRKLDVVHYTDGVAIGYDNLRIDGEVGYHCDYENKLLSSDSDRRCPAFELLLRKTYQAGCYSKSAPNKSDSYDVAFEYCLLQ